MYSAGYPENRKGNTALSVVELRIFVRNTLNPPFTEHLQCRGIVWGHTRPMALRHLLVILRSCKRTASVGPAGFCADDETFLVQESSGILGKTMAAHAGRFYVRGLEKMRQKEVLYFAGILAAMLALMLSIGPAASAHTATGGTIEGQVLGPGEVVVPGARRTIHWTRVPSQSCRASRECSAPIRTFMGTSSHTPASCRCPVNPADVRDLQALQ